MKPAWLLFFLFNSVSIGIFSQGRPAQLHLQKNGLVKSRLEQGTTIEVWCSSGEKYKGPLILLRSDSVIRVGQEKIAVSDIYKFRIDKNKTKKPITWEELAWVTFGVGLSTTGMALSKWETWESAAKISAILGYSPYAIRKIKQLSFKKYTFRLGKKFRLRVWDLN